MARWDLELFETDDEDVKFKHDCHVMCPKLESKGLRAKVKDRWNAYVVETVVYLEYAMCRGVLGTILREKPQMQHTTPCRCSVTVAV